ncbi:MAG: glycoside hydrolase family 2 TIM barrel-domain containing protein [Bacteroidales bacterium]
MRKINIIALAFSALLMVSCSTGKSDTEAAQQGPSHVEMKQTEGKYRLFVNGEEFFVKGAGGELGPIAQVAARGGNSVRTWRTDNEQRSGKEILDTAHENGLMVMMGLDVARERHGFDYDDQGAVAQQLEKFRKEVMELKDHPALLGWGIGNELNLRYTNKKVWNAVNDIARMIKEVDGNHVTTTMLAGIGKEEVDYIKEHCLDLDFISVQMYGDVINLEQRLEEAGYDGPFLLTEWGATGHWEMPSTEWGSPIEQTSTEKAMAIKERYEEVVLGLPQNCMGSYVFLWGQKQERTPSWYGLFTEQGEKTEAVNVMEYLWTGTWPEHMAPQVTGITIESQGDRFDNVNLEKNEEYLAIVDVEHQNMDSLSVRAEIMPEPVELSDGGDFEARPETIEGLIISASPTEVKFRAPREPGAYRLLVYVTDNHNNAGTVNIPFLIP